MTLVHEALHQFAFNTGVHNRWSQTPRWTSEGLALMFEAKGVHHSRKYTRQHDRVHQIHASQMKQLIDQNQVDGYIEELIHSDAVFARDPNQAYTKSWALMFYLAEHQPADLNAYLKCVGRRRSFSSYSSKQRLEDFASHFGNDLPGLESRVTRFISELP